MDETLSLAGLHDQLTTQVQNGALTLTPANCASAALVSVLALVQDGQLALSSAQLTLAEGPPAQLTVHGDCAASMPMPGLAGRVIALSSLTITYSQPYAPFTVTGTLDGALTIAGATLPVRGTLAEDGTLGFGLATGAVPNLALGDVDGFVTGGRMLAAVPSSLGIFGSLPVTALDLSVGYGLSVPTTISFTSSANLELPLFGQTKLDNIGVLLRASCTRVGLGLPRWSYGGTLTAALTIGKPFQVLVPLDNGPLWEIQLLAQNDADPPSLADLSSFAAGPDTQAALQQTGLGSITIQQVRVGYDAQARQLAYVEAAGWLTYAGAKLLLALRLPDFQFGGWLSPETPLSLKDLVTSLFSSAAGFPDATITGLSMSAAPTQQRYSLTVSIADSQFQLGPFWLDEVDLAIQSLAGSVSGSLDGMVTIGGVGIVLAAAHADGSTGWLLSGQMDAGSTISLTALLSPLLPPSFALPSGFPTVSITGAEVRCDVGGDTLYFAGSLQATSSQTNGGQTDGGTPGGGQAGGNAQSEWDLPFGQATLPIVSLSTVIDVGAKPSASADRPYTFSVSGQLHFKDINAAATYISGSVGDSLLTAHEGNTTALDLPSIAKALTVSSASQPSGQTDPQSWNDLSATVPAGLAAPGMFDASLAINLTQQVLMLYGATVAPGSTGGAGALFLATKQAPAWGYLAAFGLSPGFTFASLLPALAPLDGVLQVSQASLAITSLTAADVQTLIDALPDSTGAGQPSPRAEANQIIQLAGGPQGVTPQVAALQPGVNFYAALQLGGPLSQVAQPSAGGPPPSAPPSFRLVGYIGNAASLMTFSASLGQLRLLDLLSFEDVTLSYTGAEATTFTLSGTVVVALDEQHTYDFVGGVAVTTTTSGPPPTSTTTATASIVTTQQIQNPLNMPVLTIESLSFVLDYRSDGTQSDVTWQLGGSISFGGAVNLDAFIYFKSVTPQVAGAHISTLSVDALCAKIFGQGWPAGLLDITLRDGMLFYAPAATTLMLGDADGGPRAFPQGFHVTALIDVYALTGLQLTADLITADNPGLTASLAREAPLDWGFLCLYRAGDPAHGPLGSIDNRSHVFTLAAGVELFGTPLLSTTIQVGNSAMTGTLSSDQEVGPFGKPQLTFVWDNDGFRVTSWPLGNVKLPDFDFEDIEVSGSCPATGIARLPIRSQIDLTPSLSITMTDQAGPTLLITLNGRLDLVVNSSAYPNALLSAQIVNATLPLTLPLVSARQFSWSDLADQFVTCIKGVASSLFDNLVNDPTNLAKLLAIEGIEWGANALTEFLVCRLTTTQGLSAAEAGVQAAAFVEAASSAAPVAVTIAGAAGAVLVGGVLGQKDAQGTWTTSDQPQPVPVAPAPPRLGYASGVLTVTWDGVADASAYTVALQQDGQSFASSQPSAALAQQFAVPAGHSYSAQVLARSSGGISSPSPGTTLVVLGQPVSVSLAPTPTSITVSWTQVPSAGGYHIQLLGAGGAPLGGPTHVDPGVATQDFALASLMPGPISARVMATASDPSTVAGSWTTAASGLTLLAQPSLTGVAYSTGGLHVTWSAPVSGATGYLAQLLDENQSPAASPQSLPALSGGTPTLQATLSPPATGVTGEAIYVQVRATSSDAGVIPSVWSASPAYTPQQLLADLATAGTDQQAQALRDLFATCNGSPARVGVLLNTDATPTPAPPQVAAALKVAFPEQTTSAAAMAALLAAVYTSPSLTVQQLAGALAPLYPAAPVAATLHQNYPGDAAQAPLLALVLTAAYTAAGQSLTPTALAQALAPLYDAPSTASALGASFGAQIDGPAALAALLQGAYTSPAPTAAVMAQALGAAGYPAEQIAPVLHQLYPADTGTPAATAALLTQAYSGLTDEQLTRALAQSPYPINDVASYLKASRDPAGTGAGRIGLLLVGAYTAPALTAAQLGAALGAAGYRAADVSTALQQLFGDDTGTAAQLAALLAQSYPPEQVADVVRAEHAADTASAAQMLALLQTAYAGQGLGPAALAPGLGTYPALDAARVLRQSYPSDTANATQLAVLLDAAFDDPRLSAAQLATVLARCWYAAPDVRQALAARGSSAQDQDAALAAAYSLESLQANAVDAQAAGGSVGDTATRLYQSIAGLDVVALAVPLATALAVAGYGAMPALQALRNSYGSSLTPAELATVILAVYAPDTFARRAALLRAQHAEAAHAASDLLAGFSDRGSLVDLTIGLVLGGYPARDALSGMDQAYGHAAFVAQAAAVTLAVYAPDTYYQVAARCYAQGLDVQAATQQLQTQFASYLTADQLNQALAQAGYARP